MIVKDVQAGCGSVDHAEGDAVLGNWNYFTCRPRTWDLLKVDELAFEPPSTPASVLCTKSA